MHCVIIALFLESFSWSGIVLMERIVLLGWTCSLGASNLFGTFFIFSLDRKFSCCFLGSKLICSAFLVGQSSPSLLPVKTRKFESPMFPTCFLGLQHEIFTRLQRTQETRQGEELKHLLGMGYSSLESLD